MIHDLLFVICMWLIERSDASVLLLVLVLFLATRSIQERNYLFWLHYCLLLLWHARDTKWILLWCGSASLDDSLCSDDDANLLLLTTRCCVISCRFCCDCLFWLLLLFNWCANIIRLHGQFFIWRKSVCTVHQHSLYFTSTIIVLVLIKNYKHTRKVNFLTCRIHWTNDRQTRRLYFFYGLTTVRWCRARFFRKHTAHICSGHLHLIIIMVF